MYTDISEKNAFTNLNKQNFLKSKLQFLSIEAI